MKYRFAIVPTADGQKMISLLAGMNYSIGAEITKSTNEVTELISDFYTGGGTRIGAITRTSVGEPVSYFYGRNVIGISWFDWLRSEDGPLEWVQFIEYAISSLLALLIYIRAKRKKDINSIIWLIIAFL